MGGSENEAPNAVDEVVQSSWLAVHAPKILPKSTKKVKVYCLLTTSGILSFFKADPLQASKRQTRTNDPLETFSLRALSGLCQKAIKPPGKRFFAVHLLSPEGRIELRFKSQNRAEQWLMCLHLHLGANPHRPIVSEPETSEPVLESDVPAGEDPFALTTPHFQEAAPEPVSLGRLILSSSEESLSDSVSWQNASDAFSQLTHHPDEPEEAPREVPPAVMGPPVGFPRSRSSSCFAPANGQNRNAASIAQPQPTVPLPLRPSLSVDTLPKRPRRPSLNWTPSRRPSMVGLLPRGIAPTAVPGPTATAGLPPLTPRGPHSRRRSSIFGDLWSSKRSNHGSSGSLQAEKDREEPVMAPMSPSRKSMAPEDFPEIYGEISENSRRKSVSGWLRSKVSKKKKRFMTADFDLDLSYVHPRIIAMGFPSEQLESIYRNRMVDVQRFFQTYHAGHFRIYNLCSERSYEEEKFTKFGGSCLRIPFDDHNPCEFDQIVRFCEDAASFLRENRFNVVAVHCKAGKGRTGMMVSCLLMYLKVKGCRTAQQALDYYAKHRTKDMKGVTIPSQRRYVRYFEQWMRMYGQNLEPLPYDDDLDAEVNLSDEADEAADFVPSEEYFNQLAAEQGQPAEATAESIPSAVLPGPLEAAPLVLESISVTGSRTAFKQSAVASSADPARPRRGSFVKLLSTVSGAGRTESMLVAEVYKPRSRPRDAKNTSNVLWPRNFKTPQEDTGPIADTCPDEPIAVSMISAKHSQEDKMAALKFAGGGLNLWDDVYIAVREVTAVEQYPWHHLMNPEQRASKPSLTRRKGKLPQPGKQGVLFKAWLNLSMIASCAPEITSQETFSGSPDPDPAPRLDITLRKSQLDGIRKDKSVEESFGCTLHFLRHRDPEADRAPAHPTAPELL